MTVIRNERLKLAANFLNAGGIGLIGIAVLFALLSRRDQPPMLRWPAGRLRDSQSTAQRTIFQAT